MVLYQYSSFLILSLPQSGQICMWTFALLAVWAGTDPMPGTDPNPTQGTDPNN